MKKRLLFGALLMGSFFTANAQDDCAGAVEVTSGVTVTVEGVDGDYQAGCWQTAATAGEWYTFTAPALGMITITSNLPQNVGPEFSTDTRFSVYTGSCEGTLTCYSGNDDVDGVVFLSEVSFPVEAGEELFIVWDNYWSPLGFDFELTFTEESCFAATNFVYTEAPTFTTAGIGWSASTFGSAPEGYNVEYGPAGFELGEGMEGTVTVTGTGGSVAIEGLTSGTDYEFWIQTNCGDGDLGEWFGPIGFTTAFEAAETPYEYSFETANLNGWTVLNAGTGSTWSVGVDAAGSPAQDGDLYMMAGANGGISDAWLFSRGLDLTAGNTYKVTYYARKWTIEGDGNENNLEVTWGDDTTAAAQENVLATYEDFDEADYEMYENTFTPETSGTYYIGFNYTAPAHTVDDHGRIQLDNVSIEDVTGGINDVLASKFTVYPNPANNVINIANAENILVNGVVITDLNGRTVKNVAFDGVAEAQINVSELAAGMYMMTVSSDKGTMTKKIVKN